MKCLQFQNISKGVDISNYHSYETFFTKYYESNTWSHREKKGMGLYTQHLKYLGTFSLSILWAYW